MRQRLLIRSLMISALIVFTAFGTAGAEYLEGSLYGRVISKGTPGSFVPAGNLVIPQVTLSDRTVTAGTEVKVSTNVVVSLRLALGEIPEEFIEGNARLTVYYVEESGEILSYALGTFDLQAEDEGTPFVITGPIVGDQYSLYLAAKFQFPGGSGPEVFYCRVNPPALVTAATGELAIADEFLGRARIALRGTMRRTVADNLAGSYTMGPAASSITGLTPGVAVINQVTPPDGSADFTLPADTAGIEYRPQRAGNGRMTGSGTSPLPGNFSLTAHGIYPIEGGRDGEGLSFGRFTLTPDAGGALEGFLVTDAADSVGELQVGYIFSQVSSGPMRGFLFGEFAASYDDAGGFTGGVDAILYDCDSSPPEVGEIDLFDDRRDVFSWFRDLDGWPDIKSVYFLINKNRTAGGVYGRYDVRTDKLFLFNKAIGKWVGGIRPGTRGRWIRTPWVTLDCEETSVWKNGEYIFINWVIEKDLRSTLTRKMEGTWNIYGKAVDNAGQVTGWRHIAPTTIDLYP